MSKYKFEFILPGLPQMTNALGRKLWFVKAKEAREWKRAVHLAVWLHRPAAPLPFAKLTLVRCSATEPDFDGLVSCFKHIIDGLVSSGILANDRTSNIGQPRYRWEKTPKGKGCVKVTVEEWDKTPLHSHDDSLSSSDPALSEVSLEKEYLIHRGDFKKES